MKKFSIDWFIDFFEKIPKDKFCRNDFKRGNRYCARGFCGATDRNNATPMDDALVKLVPYIATINNGHSDAFKQKSCKDRVLAALKFSKINGKHKSLGFCE